MVSVPKACEAFADRVPFPAHKAGDDALKLLGRYRAALAEADDRIDARNACEAAMRADFARGGAFVKSR
jgi:hypothetical protein